MSNMIPVDSLEKALAIKVREVIAFDFFEENDKVMAVVKTDGTVIRYEDVSIPFIRQNLPYAFGGWWTYPKSFLKTPLLHQGEAEGVQATRYLVSLPLK